MKQVSFETTQEEDKVIKAIVERAKATDRLCMTMDLSACNANGCKLDFDKLLSFDDFNFFHDISGISNPLNRSTGKLENCFLPRCAK